MANEVEVWRLLTTADRSVPAEVMMRHGIPLLALIAALAPARADAQPSPVPSSTPAAVASPAAAASPASMVGPSPTASPADLTIDPAIVARAKDWLHRMATNTIDRSQLDEKMNSLLTDSIASQIAAQFGPLGDPTDVQFVGKNPIANSITYRFRTVFPSVTFLYLFSLDDHGKISGLRFVPAK